MTKAADPVSASATLLGPPAKALDLALDQALAAGNDDRTGPLALALDLVDGLPPLDAAPPRRDSGDALPAGSAGDDHMMLPQLKVIDAVLAAAIRAAPPPPAAAAFPDQADDLSRWRDRIRLAWFNGSSALPPLSTELDLDRQWLAGNPVAANPPGGWIASEPAPEPAAEPAPPTAAPPAIPNLGDEVMEAFVAPITADIAPPPDDDPPQPPAIAASVAPRPATGDDTTAKAAAPAPKPTLRLKVKTPPRAPDPAAPPPPPAKAAPTLRLVTRPAPEKRTETEIVAAPPPSPPPTPQPEAAVSAAPEAPPPPDEAVSTPPEVPPPPPDDAASTPPEAPPQTDPLAVRVEAIIAAHCPPGRDVRPAGSSELPANRDALARLLDDPPPADDFACLDLLNQCWDKNTHDSDQRALLAVAYNLGQSFGLPDKRPMATTRAWRLADPRIFAEECADRLRLIARFIAEWQKTQRVFLILEFGEIELIEHLFEALDPADYPELLAEVMNFKVLSNRRMGLLRRIPARLRRQTQPLLPDRKEEALVILAHGRALLQRIAIPTGFAPIVEVAQRMADEVEKMMKQAANAGAPPGLPGMPPGALGKIG